MKLRPLVIMTLLLVGAACKEENIIDGSSKESFEQSVEDMTVSLSDEDKTIFSKGLLHLVVTEYPPAKGIEGLEILPFLAPATEAAHRTMDGVHFDTIMAKGREVAGKDTDPRKVEVRSCLQNKVRLSTVELKFEDLGPDLHFDVTNNLDWAISAIRIGYSVTSPGRSVPWEEDDFWIKISGGIEPGEIREEFSVSVFGIPSTAPRDEIQVTAEVLDVQDSEEKWLVEPSRNEEKSTHTCMAKNGEIAEEAAARAAAKSAARAAEEAAERAAEEAAETEKREISACLKNKVLLDNVEAKSDDFGFDSLIFDVTNNLDWAISAIRVGYSITSPGRSVPWKEDTFWVSISGGIEPGEIREQFSVSAFSIRIPSAAPRDEIQVTAEVLDVQDSEEKWLVEPSRNEEKSTRTCN